MAFQQSDLDAVNEAIAAGALRVKYGDKEVFYRSLADLQKTKTLIEAELCPATPKVRTHGIYFKNEGYRDC